jgi:hypothetical protein
MEKKLFQMPYIKQLQDELYNYEWDDKQLETDCVMSLGLACWEANSTFGALFFIGILCAKEEKELDYPILRALRRVIKRGSKVS